VVVEIALIFLLFYHKTRISAISLGIFFQILLVLTLDVPATFFFLFPAQLLLFINPVRIEHWINQKRQHYRQSKRSRLVYDGHCQFCIKSVQRVKVLDMFGTCEYVDLQNSDLKELHPELNKELAMSQLHLVEADGSLFGGFFVFRRICFTMPMMYPMILLFYFPGMGLLGPLVYRWVAKNRYLFHLNPACKNNACFR